MPRTTMLPLVALLLSTSLPAPAQPAASAPGRRVEAGTPGRPLTVCCDPAPEHLDGRIPLGIIVEGERLEHIDDVDTFTFEGRAGEEYQVNLQTTEAGGGVLLELVAPAALSASGKEELLAVIDSAAMQDHIIASQLVRKGRLPTTGTFMVRVLNRRMDGRSITTYTGGYRFRVLRVASAPAAVPPPDAVKTGGPGDVGELGCAELQQLGPDGVLARIDAATTGAPDSALAEATKRTTRRYHACVLERFAAQLAALPQPQQLLLDRLTDRVDSLLGSIETLQHHRSVPQRRQWLREHMRSELLQADLWAARMSALGGPPEPPPSLAPLVALARRLAAVPGTPDDPFARVALNSARKLPEKLLRFEQELQSEPDPVARRTVALLEAQLRRALGEGTSR